LDLGLWFLAKKELKNFRKLYIPLSI